MAGSGGAALYRATPTVNTIEDDSATDWKRGRRLRGVTAEQINGLSGQQRLFNKHQALISGINQSVLLRTIISDDKRRSMFPPLGSSGESPAVYLDPSYIFRQAENRNRQGSHSVGMGKALVCKGKYYWGRFGDKEFLLKIALFLLEDFDSFAEKRLCMEHFSRSNNPTAIKDCMELADCLSGLLSTYDELWGLGWKKELGPTFTDFLEWHYASRVVLYFFFHLQEAARLPRTGIVRSCFGQRT